MRSKHYMKNLWSVLIHLLVLMLLFLGTAPESAAQSERPPELSMEYHRAEAAWRSGASLLEAKARLDRVLEERPDDFEARTLRAEVLLAMGRPEEALDDARRATQLVPESGRAHLIMAEAARLSSNLELAEEELDAAAEHLVDDAALHIRFSWNAALLGRLDQAEAFARIALALDEDSAAAYYQLARVFMLKKQPDQAAAILERGLRASLLNAGGITQDSVLTRVKDHPSLRGFVQE